VTQHETSIEHLAAWCVEKWGGEPINHRFRIRMSLLYVDAVGELTPEKELAAKQELTNLYEYETPARERPFYWVDPAGDLEAGYDAIRWWRWAFSEADDLAPTVRHVLHVLSMLMDTDDGKIRGAWPGRWWIAEHVGLSKARIDQVIPEAVRAGWLTITPLRRADGSRRGSLYGPAIPEGRGGVHAPRRSEGR
jgi:hypothetical protein